MLPQCSYSFPVKTPVFFRPRILSNTYFNVNFGGSLVQDDVTKRELASSIPGVGQFWKLPRGSPQLFIKNWELIVKKTYFMFCLKYYRSIAIVFSHISGIVRIPGRKKPSRLRLICFTSTTLRFTLNTRQTQLKNTQQMQKFGLNKIQNK